MQSQTNNYLEVAVPVPLRQTFQYLPPPGGELPEPGARVLVPFGKQEMVGVFLGFSNQPATDRSRLRSVIEILDEEAVISRPVIALCRWAASYYHHPVGEVFTAALPVLLRRGIPATDPETELVPTGDPSNPPSALSRAPRQRKLLELLRKDGPATRYELAERGFGSHLIRALLERGLVTWRRRETVPVSGAVTAAGLVRDYQGIEPNRSQRHAIRQISSPGVYLLHGVTGSGKTEIYLRLIESTLEKGRQVLVLIPEIGLTPQTLNRFTDRFAVSTEILHSGLTDNARLSSWRHAASGEARIIIGTRSAVFVSLAQPGLVIVDEEHDLSYKQQDGFRYSARDLAVMRARMEGIPVILGSATPSLESLQNCERGKYHLIELSHRTGDAEPERYQIVDIRHRDMREGLSAELVKAISTTLASGNQVLIFLNRRGFAPVLYCSACQWIACCRHCDSRLTYHLDQERLLCHHCGTRARIPDRCESCAATHLVPLGLGTQRVEGTLNKLFGDYPVYRVDRDTTRGRHSLTRMVQKLESGNPAILIGTQMLAKGHHFPDVTLVAIVDIDSGFFSADYRAIERTGQLILQVGGRSGRASKPGRVILQTRFPEHPLLRKLIHEGYGSFARAVLMERKASNLPPYSHHCLLRADSREPQVAMKFLDKVAEQPLKTPRVEMLGPVPPLMEKRNGRYRAQLLLASGFRKSLSSAIDEKIATATGLGTRRNIRWSVDVDPAEPF